AIFPRSGRSRSWPRTSPPPRPRHPRGRLSLSPERLSAGRRRLRGQPVRRRLADLEGRFLRPRRAGPAGAPWIVVRGNHEICKRAGAGYFRLLDATPAASPPPCIDVIPQFKVTIGEQAFIVFDSSSAADKCPCDPAAYAAQFDAMRPAAGTWLLTHRPIWG